MVVSHCKTVELSGVEAKLLLWAVSFILGMAVASWIFLREIRKQANFLANRSSSSGSRVKVHLPGKSWKFFARAINDALDAVQQSHVKEMRRSRELQEDICAISHDMKTPLAGARGYIQLGQRELSEDECRANAYLCSAIERVDAAAALLDTLSAYVQTQDPDRKYRFEPTPLLPLVIEVLTDQLAELENRGWEPDVHFMDESIRVMADRAALKRILTNLVTNALRYGVSAPAIEETGSDKTWELRISNRVNNADGIDPTMLFHRFYRGDPSRGTRGTGLGLSIAKTLANDMGFDLDASVSADESRPADTEEQKAEGEMGQAGGTITFILKQTKHGGESGLTPIATTRGFSAAE